VDQMRKNTIFAGYNRLFREGMNLLLGERFDINHVESFKDALKAIQTGNLAIDLLIGDPGNNVSAELNAISEISQQFPEVRIIALAPEVSQAMLDALINNGVGGVLSSDISVAALRYSIEIVMLGERIVPTVLSSSAGVSARTPSTGSDTSQLGDHLSGRERQILHYLMDGLPNKLIARHLDISEATIKVHLKMLLRKLRIHNRTQAAVWALNHGFQKDDAYSGKVVPGTSLNPRSELSQHGLS
jgi:two-component system nitrate/nitrite response regulator NarL